MKNDKKITIVLSISVKKLIIFLSIIVLSFLIIYTLRAYYYSHWQFIYYGKSENFEGEVLVVPAKIEKKTLKSLREFGGVMKMYYGEVWLNCKKPDEIKIHSLYITDSSGEVFYTMQNGNDYIFPTLSKLSKDGLIKKFKDTNWFLITHYYPYLDNYKDYKVYIKIVDKEGGSEIVELKYLGSFPFILRTKFIPPCKPLTFNSIES